MSSINQSHVFRSLSVPSLAHNPSMYNIYIPSQIPVMMPAVPSLSATEIEKFPPPKKSLLSFQSSFNCVRFTPA